VSLRGAVQGRDLHGIHSADSGSGCCSVIGAEAGVPGRTLWCPVAARLRQTQLLTVECDARRSWCCSSRGPGAAAPGGLVLQLPGAWCCSSRGPGAAAPGGLVLQPPGAWCCSPWGPGAAAPGAWCCSSRGLVLQPPRARYCSARALCCVTRCPTRWFLDGLIKTGGV